MRRTDRRVPPLWVQAPGRASPAPVEPPTPTATSPPVAPATGWPPHELPNPPPDPGQLEPVTSGSATGPRWGLASWKPTPAVEEPVSGARTRTGGRTRGDVRAFPRGRLVGIVTTAATVAAVGGALALPTAGPAPAGGPAVGDPGHSAAVETAAPAPAPSEPENAGPEQTHPPPPGPPTSEPPSADGDRTGSPADSPRSDEGPSAGGAVLGVRAVDRLGQVAVDAGGFTLYRFDGDADGAATCTDACASTWQPVVVDPESRLGVAGIEPTDVGMVRRPDGAVQLTLGGWPVYRFAGDSRPGRGGGHGIGGVWFAVTPTGAKSTAAG